MSDLQVSTTDRDAAVIVSIAGDASVDNITQLQTQFMKLLARKPEMVVLDLSGLWFIASIGMGVLVSLNRDVKRYGGEVRLAGVQPDVRQAFERSRLDQMFELHSDVEAALAG